MTYKMGMLNPTHSLTHSLVDNVMQMACVICVKQEDQTWALKYVIFHVKSVVLRLQAFTLELSPVKDARLVVMSGFCHNCFC